MESIKVPSFKLSCGTSIPGIGLGVVNLNNTPNSHTREVILHAIKLGYRYFDTAQEYDTEDVLGDAIGEALRSGMVNREDLFICSKLWSDSHDRADVMPALQKTLMNLKLEYLDLYLIHLPLKVKKGAHYPPKEDELLPLDIEQTWSALEICCDKGLTKAIGVSNFSVDLLAQLLNHARILPAVNQVEMNPLWQQRKLRKFCDSIGVHISAWSPLGAPGTSYGSDNVLTNPIVKSLSSKYNKTPAQVALRWCFQSKVDVLCKSFTPSRILENISIFNWELSEEDMNEISKIKQKSIGILEEDYIRLGIPYKGYIEFDNEGI